MFSHSNFSMLKITPGKNGGESNVHMFSIYSKSMANVLFILDLHAIDKNIDQETEGHSK